MRCAPVSEGTKACNEAKARVLILIRRCKVCRYLCIHMCDSRDKNPLRTMPNGVDVFLARQVKSGRLNSATPELIVEDH